MNKVNVNIFGKDYTVVGDREPERIARIAAHVDGKMSEIAEEATDIPVSSVAVLSCMQVTDEYFALLEKVEALERQREQDEQEKQHYIQLWEEAKNSFVEFKRDSQKEAGMLKESNEQLRAQLHAKDREVEELMRTQEKVEAVAREDAASEIEEAKRQYSDLENNYFDLQMQNIRLKSEIEKLRNDNQWQRNERQDY